jgi:hypothetical protein
LKKRFQKRILIILVTAGLIGISGCIPRAKYERTEMLSGLVAAGATLTATTHNGYINVSGGEFSECSVTARIITKADTEENAKKLSDLVKVKLEETADGMAVVIDKPEKLKNKYVVVELDITLPSNLSLKLKTHNGAVGVFNIEGSVEAITHNGSVTAKDVSGDGFLTTHNGQVNCSNFKGDLKLQTHNGKIGCDGAIGDVDVRTHNGNADIAYSNAANGAINGHIETHNGNVNLKAPAELSVKLDASTHNSSVNSTLPVAVIDEIKNNRIKGTIGTGEGSLFLKTYNGSINIK